ncbi:MAG: peptidylprolyl isomerase [Trueperaceae bacterium]|nr:MAG: peptidylprolyl isomerase [Trueperaceae bacterium]
MPGFLRSISTVLIYIVFLLGASLVFTSVAQEDVAPEEDLVLVQIGEMVETLASFNQRFEITIRSLAANQGVVLTDDLRTRLATFKPQFLEQRITEMVLLQEAELRGIGISDEELDARIGRIQASVQPGQTYEQLLADAGFSGEEHLRQLLMENELVQRVVVVLQDGIDITDDQLQEAYEANLDQFTTPEQVCARHILLETEEDANGVLEDLEMGGDFAELAQERSTGPSGPSGGELGCFSRGRMVPPFEEASFAAEVDSPVGPVETQFGFHVILVYERQEPGTRSIEEVRVQLEQQLRGERLPEVISALESASGVESFPELLTPPAPPEEAADEGSDATDDATGDETGSETASESSDEAGGEGSSETDTGAEGSGETGDEGGDETGDETSDSDDEM